MDYLVLYLTIIYCLTTNVSCYVKLPLHRDSSIYLEKTLKAKANSVSINGTVAVLTLKYSEGFIGNISIGTPDGEQDFNLLIDTESTLLWVTSSECTTLVCRNHNVYSYQWSKTYVSKDQFKQIKDGHDTLLGLGAEDVVNIGSIKVKNVPFYLVNDLPNDFLTNKTYDGAIGLSLPIKIDDEPILELMSNQRALEWNLFSLYINKSNGPKYHGGELMLGGWNTKYFNPDEIDYIPLSKTGKWQFTIDRITSVENTKGVWCSSGCEATISTTFEYIQGPAKEIKAIYQYIGASIDLLPGIPLIKCNQIEQLPAIKFHMNKEEYILEGKDYTTHIPNMEILTSDEICIFNFIIANNPNDPWKIGYRFLSNYYTIFNISEKKIAFAKLK